MLKIRITYEDRKELDIALNKIKNNFEVLDISREYKGRGNSKFSNIYISVNIGDSKNE